MLNLNPDKIYISSANVDMRKSIDGLSAIVQQKFDLNPFENAMFVFHNRHCDKIKVTVKANNLNPYEYLEQIFSNIQQGTDPIKYLP